MSEVLSVVQPGVLTTIQDLGRPQAITSGVPPGGAMDRFAHSAANLLVGNERGVAALECTLVGPRLVALRDCEVAIAGADLAASVNGVEAPTWTALSLRAGDELGFGHRRSGARAYVAVAGGVAGDRWLGSVSTNLMCARGGMQGRRLAAGDVISAPDLAELPASGATLAADLRPDYTEHLLRLVPGPHFSRLDTESRRVLWSETFTVTPDSNRMGYRLSGPPLGAPGDELLSFAVVAGTLQLPAGGQPILLMADHQTAGGYPVIATVAGAWMRAAAQLGPGDQLRFAEISITEALAARAAQRAALESLTSGWP